METFKDCTKCKHAWTTRDEFLHDDEIVLIGFLANNDEFEKGAYLFNHVPAGNTCNTSFGLYVSSFLDMYEGKIYDDLKMGTEDCSGHCAKIDVISNCHAHCRNAVAREIMHKIVEILPAHLKNSV
jgi:hypothetical protein